jgi:four helix bundle protein
VPWHRLCVVRVVLVSRYEELAAWQPATELRQLVIRMTNRDNVRDDRRFCDQSRSSAASVTANIAEGFGRYSDPDFVRFLRYARGSAFETREWLREGKDRGHFNEPAFEEAWSLLDRATGALTRLTAEVDHRVRRSKATRR